MNKKIVVFFIVIGLLIIFSCTTTIPVQANLSDQIMLLAKNKNIKANYTLVSEVPDTIPYIFEYKSSTQGSSAGLDYNAELAFNKIWGAYFSNKFNSYSTDQMNILVTLISLSMKEKSATSTGMMLLTGNVKSNIEAVAKIHVIIDYRGKKYENEFNISSAEYQESQQIQAGSMSYTKYQTNPTQQKSILFENCLNRSIIEFENFLNSAIFTNSEQ
jgi:hypothetical protein